MRTSQPSDAAQGDEPDEPEKPMTVIRKEMEALREMIESKIPKPRGRPKKNTSNSSFSREDVL